MYGKDVGSLSVDVGVGETSGDFKFTRVWKITPPSDAAEPENDVWRSHAFVSLADYAADIQLRIRGKRGSGGKVRAEAGLEPSRRLQ